MQRSTQLKLGPYFEIVDCRVDRTRTLPFAGDLDLSKPQPAACEARRVFEVHGGDMIDEGIKAGDRLLIETRDPMPDGATALVDLDGRFMVKRFCRESDGNVRLEPANRALLPLVLRSDRVRVHGMVIGLVRRRGFGAASRPVQNGTERGAAPVRPRQATDLTYRMLEQNLGEWTRITATRAGRLPRNAGSLRIRELGRSLRALVATYSTLTNPRLRRALLEEAAKISREMRYVAAASGWPTSRIRPLVSSAGDRARRPRD